MLLQSDSKITEYLINKKALIICSSNATRSVIRSALLGSGMINNNITTAKRFSEAVSIIETIKPEIIFADYEIDENFGLELSFIQRDFISDTSQKIFFALSDSGTASAVADAAEEEVESFLIKPLNEGTIISYIQRIVREKINPSEKTMIMAKAREMIKNNQLPAAEKFLTLSMVSVDNPAIIYYYLGLIHEKRGHFASALSYYNLGLENNANHFKSLYGKFMMSYRTGDKSQAYNLINQIRKKFPLTPELLKIAFCVVIETNNFKEIEDYYQLYLKQIRKPEDLKFVVSTALLTAGKAFLRQNGQIDIALNYFTKGSIISGRQTDYIENVIQELTKQGFPNKLSNFFEMFKAGDISDKILKPLRFKQYMRELRSEDYLLEEGKKMIFEKVANEECLEIILEMAKRKGNAHLLQSLALKAIEIFPENRKFYCTYLE